MHERADHGSSEWSSSPDGLSASLMESSSEASSTSPADMVDRPMSHRAGMSSMLGRRSWLDVGTDSTLDGGCAAGGGSVVGAAAGVASTATWVWGAADFWSVPDTHAPTMQIQSGPLQILGCWKIENLKLEHFCRKMHKIGEKTPF